MFSCARADSKTTSKVMGLEAGLAILNSLSRGAILINDIAVAGTHDQVRQRSADHDRLPISGIPRA